METSCQMQKWFRLVCVGMLGAGLLMFTLASLRGAALAAQIVTVPAGPSLVSVRGAQLIVQKRMAGGAWEAPQAYTIRGVNWSPDSRCPKPSDEFAHWYLSDTQQMATMGVNTVRMFDIREATPTMTQMLDSFYEHDIMVIMTVVKVVTDSNVITATVNAYKNHPAILMWAIGNEWDYDHYQNFFTNTAQAAAFTEQMAHIIKGLDSNHPVASVLSDIYRDVDQPDLDQPLFPLPWRTTTVSSWDIVNTLVPSVDVWGVNIYRNATFGGLFGEWKQISAKPVFLAEFGTDSYDHRLNGENQGMQAEFDAGLWQEIFRHLSARWPSQASLGGLVFEWNDEWTKQGNGNPCVQEHTSEQNGGHPDNYNDEEWFGLETIDRQPKQSYSAMRKYYLSNSAFTAAVSSTLSVSSNLSSLFFADRASWCSRGGTDAIGRGINFGILDPLTGAIEDCRNFDTWYDHQAFVTMTEYVSNSTAIPSGQIVLVAIADDGGFIQYTPPQSGCHTPWSDPRVELGYQALEKLGSTQIRSVGFRGSWAMITIKGGAALTETYRDPIYSSTVGYCQTQDRVATQITTTLPITRVYPGFRVYLPIIFKSAVISASSSQ